MNKVLVVDDDQEILTMASFVLHSYGYKVKTEYKWENTFKDIKAFEPDIILLDIKLRGEDGRNISKQIKSDITTKHISVILFSAIKGIGNELGDCLNNDFISKPFEATDLINKIKIQLQKITTANNSSADQQLMLLMADQPHEAFSSIYDKYAPILFGYILSIIKDEEQSEAILMTLFLRIFENNQHYNLHKESVLLWCMRLANNTIIESNKYGRKQIASEVFYQKLNY
ncbi:MAG: response regulator, partial [Ginsengibacter sp.]